MRFRRAFLVICAMLFVSAAPAAADYNDILGEGQGRTPTVVSAGGPATSAEEAGSLARTGSSNLLPAAEAATALIGGGALLVLAARRRRTARRPATA